MSKIFGALIMLVACVLVSACAHTGEMPTVRAGNDPDTSQARSAARAAGGTTGIESLSGLGSIH